MIRFNILFFASLRESFGFNHKQIEVSKNIRTLNELLEHMSLDKESPWPNLTKNKKCYRVAINQELSSWDDNISDGDEIAFFPPITGG
jgi:molybdopterin synthase sulfur carrier subunit